MKEYHPGLQLADYTEGQEYLFINNNKKVIGKVLDKGKTLDDIEYIETTVGNYTRKFIVNNGFPKYSKVDFEQVHIAQKTLKFEGVNEVVEGLTEATKVETGVTEISKKVQDGVREVLAASGVAEVE